MPQDEERLPVAIRAVAYVIALIVTLISILLATWLYMDFEFLRRVHWIKTNLIALVLIGTVKDSDNGVRVGPMDSSTFGKPYP